MQRNVEIKAKVRDLNFIIEKAKCLSKSEGQVLKQKDVFFVVPQGRLKLREFETGSAELIFYDRPDGDGPKLSKFEKCFVENSSELSSVLARALGTKGIVEKTRQLFIVGQTRVHVDCVDNLGDFMELERRFKVVRKDAMEQQLLKKIVFFWGNFMPGCDVMLNADQTLEDGQRIAEALMAELGVNKEDLIAGAYMDLLLK